MTEIVIEITEKKLDYPNKEGIVIAYVYEAIVHLNETKILLHKLNYN